MTDYIKLQERLWYVEDMVRSFKPPSDTTNDSRDIIVPESQREWAWKNKSGLKKQQLFIDSIINGFPVPTIILNMNLDRKYEVYDGRHRIETLQRFAQDKFKWNGKLYSELNDLQKRIFNSRQLPVTITERATRTQLAEVFVRLNAGSPLKDYDKFWARSDRPLLRAVYRHVVHNERLSYAFGNYDMGKRQDLANWVALVYGLATRNPGNITTSYIRVTEDHSVCGLDIDIDDEFIKSGIDALCEMLETVNLRFTTEGDKKKQRLKKVGFVIAFFIAEWITSENKEETISKWADIAGRARDGDKPTLSKLRVTGAQNLTNDKIEKVLKQINNETGIDGEETSEYDEEDD